MFLFGFRKFIAPSVLKALYYISVLTFIFGAAGVVIYALAEMQALGLRQALAMIAGAVIGAPVLILLSRFMTELWLVLFEMNQRLGQIRDK